MDIDDLKALLARFLRENTSKYQLQDERPDEKEGDYPEGELGSIEGESYEEEWEYDAEEEDKKEQLNEVDMSMFGKEKKTDHSIQDRDKYKKKKKET